MSKLRNKIIRLAHANPELRDELLPLLKEATDDGGVYQRYLETIIIQKQTLAINSVSFTEHDHLTGGGTH